MQGCVAIISIVSELICVFAKRGREYNLSCWKQLLVSAAAEPQLIFIAFLLSFVFLLPFHHTASVPFIQHRAARQLVEKWRFLFFFTCLAVPA